jgi:ketosteroid isomerase-like protein
MLSKPFFLLLLLGFTYAPSFGQSGRQRASKPPLAQQATALTTPNTPKNAALYEQIARLDAEMFAAFNAADVAKLMAFFTDDLEFYHDKGGLSNYTQTQQSFASLFAQSPDIQRSLAPGSMKVYPIKDFGAVQIGVHRFCHKENGKDDCGNFKFMMLWRQKGDTWKINRVVSYDH